MFQEYLQTSRLLRDPLLKPPPACLLYTSYAELIETGIAKPEDVPGFAQKIHGEVSRMIQLVNDILQLSSLDNASETSSMPEMEVVDLLDVVKELSLIHISNRSAGPPMRKVQCAESGSFSL